MPQVFQVLKCFKCLVFQVHQTKKSNKWKCKMCDETQSIKRHYGLGSGKECRLHVQKLNGIRSELDDLSVNKEPEEINDKNEDFIITNKHNITTLKQSKWCNFIDKTEQVLEPNESDKMFLGDTEVALVPNKKRKFNNPKKTKNVTNEHNINHSTFISKLKVQENSSLPTSTVNTSIEIVTQIAYITEKSPNSSNSPEYYIPAKSDKNPQSKIFVLPKVDQCSKWAQYAEDDAETIEDEKCQESTNNLFSLCDENDLDDVLAL